MLPDLRREKVLSFPSFFPLPLPALKLTTSGRYLSETNVVMQDRLQRTISDLLGTLLYTADDPCVQELQLRTLSIEEKVTHFVVSLINHSLEYLASYCFNLCFTFFKFTSSFLMYGN